MANDIHTPDRGSNYSIRDTAPADKADQPWNRSRMEIEPSPETPTPEAKGRYNDRIRVSPMNDKGQATPKAVRNWPMGPKRA
jgi:hypothetical protein